MRKRGIISVFLAIAVALTALIGSGCGDGEETETTTEVTTEATTVAPIVPSAYSVGGSDLGDFNISVVKSACDYFALCGYRSYYTCEPTRTKIVNNLNKEILYFSTHGGENNVSIIVGELYLVTPEDPYSHLESRIDIGEYPWDRVKLCIYDCCGAASDSDGDGKNICTSTLEQGANCVIGWKETIYQDTAFEWQKRFQNQLALGYSIKEAALYANRFSYDENSIKNWKIYGDSSQIIKISSKASVSLLQNEEDFVYYDLSKTTSMQSSDDIIKSIFPTFEPGNYKVAKTTNNDESNYTIDYNLMVDGYVTDKSYVVIYEDEKAIGLQENNVTLTVPEDIPDLPLIDNKVIDAAYVQAQNEVKSENNEYTIVEQSGEPYYDLKTNTCYYRVYTVYSVGDGTKAAINTNYKIS